VQKKTSVPELSNPGAVAGETVLTFFAGGPSDMVTRPSAMATTGAGKLDASKTADYPPVKDVTREHTNRKIIMCCTVLGPLSAQ